MKHVGIWLVTLLVLPTAFAVAGTGRNSCLAEQEVLRARAEDKCSGLSYLLDPSSCFIARKALARHTACEALPEPERPSEQTSPGQAAAQVPVPAAAGAGAQSRETQQPTASEPDLERLKSENARLREEVARLKAEVEQFRKDCPSR